jgi:hypothetical protein
MDYISGRTWMALYVGLGFGNGFSNVSEIPMSSKMSAQHNMTPSFTTENN